MQHIIEQLDLFASERRDTYIVTAPVPSAEAFLPTTATLGGRPAGGGDGEPALALTQSGEVLSLPADWEPKHRLDTFKYLVHTAVGAVVGWRRVVVPAAGPTSTSPGRPPRESNSGNLYRVGEDRRGIIVDLNGAEVVDKRQGRVCLHIPRAFHEQMLAHRTAIQGVITRVRRPGCLDRIVVAAIPYDLVAPIAEAAFARGTGHRAAIYCEIVPAAWGTALRLRGEGFDIDVTRYAGVEALAAALRGTPGEPWRAFTHADWMAAVATVLTVRDGLHCSVAVHDARKRVTRAMLDEVGIDRLRGHDLGLHGTTPDADLLHTDVIGAACSPDLRRAPRQPLVAVEIDLHADMTAPDELARRVRSAARLGLNVERTIVVADERKRTKYAARCDVLDQALLPQREFWPMHDVYREYEAARRARLGGRARPCAARAA